MLFGDQPNRYATANGSVEKAAYLCWRHVTGAFLKTDNLLKVVREPRHSWLTPSPL